MTGPRWDSDEDRYVSARASYLVRTTNLNDSEARVLALREIGYSNSGIANRVDLTEATVSKYLAGIIYRYGEAAAETKLPDEISVDAPLRPARTGGDGS